MMDAAHVSSYSYRVLPRVSLYAQVLHHGQRQVGRHCDQTFRLHENWHKTSNKLMKIIGSRSILRTSTSTCHLTNQQRGKKSFITVTTQPFREREKETLFYANNRGQRVNAMHVNQPVSHYPTPSLSSDSKRTAPVCGPHTRTHAQEPSQPNLIHDKYWHHLEGPRTSQSTQPTACSGSACRGLELQATTLKV